jgi:3-methyladenine DNA glycosylase AlkD
MARGEKQILSRLKSLGRPDALPHMAHFGIDTSNAYGVAVPELRRLAKEIGTDHALALALWRSGIHDARILATMIAAPSETDRALAESWAGDFRSWDLCDQCCINLLRKLPFAAELVENWRAREAEFVKRAAFALIAVLAVHDKSATDAHFTAWLPLIEQGATDERNFVKKAVNWALRQIGKRNAVLNREAVDCARRIAAGGTRPGRWIATHALRELQSEAVQTRIELKG